MSTIVVVKKSGKAVIAADTMSSLGDTKVTSKYLNGRSKIHKCGPSYVGVLGSAAHNNVLASIIRKYQRRLSFNGVEDIFETCLKLHPILKDEYFLNVDEGDNDDYESSQLESLIANPRGIFGVYSWREVFEYERFWALGSGMEFALGAMHAAYDLVESPEEIAQMGITASCEFDNSSGLPFTLHSMKLTKRERNKNRKGA
jgi:ATP-dependent protease HslVU (ClpYQ) peptidase subunit